jgi:hypothetical protein
MVDVTLGRKYGPKALRWQYERSKEPWETQEVSCIFIEWSMRIDILLLPSAPAASAKMTLCCNDFTKNPGIIRIQRMAMNGNLSGT